MESNYLSSVIKQFEYNKHLGDSTLAQLPDEALFWQYNPESNSIAMIAQHLAGNMLSRFTDFLTADGEKDWRDREAEFEPTLLTRAEVLAHWEAGWACLFQALHALDETHLSQTVYIRNMGHTVVEAINRQVAHYAYHVGQMVYLGRMMAGANWQSLSIPKGGTAAYNAEKFAAPQRDAHFADEFIPKDKD